MQSMTIIMYLIYQCKGSYMHRYLAPIIALMPITSFMIKIKIMEIFYYDMI
jgi:hypothetical protein